jgi:hypothetical protein
VSFATDLLTFTVVIVGSVASTFLPGFFFLSDLGDSLLMGCGCVSGKFALLPVVFDRLLFAAFSGTTE